jgi:signal transduction histidine kinase
MNDSPLPGPQDAPLERAPERTLRVLHLEDDPADALLVREVLAEGGLACEIRRVATRDAFDAALRAGNLDLVLSDFALPAYDGTSALVLAREVCPDLPFIVVSGTIGEEAAIASLRAGATDYVLKDRLGRLCPAVNRALREAEERRARARAEEERRRLEARLHQSQKLEVVGQLAGGVAHDFNNLLVVINSYVELALEKLMAEDPLRADLEEVQKAGARAAALTRQLLAFSRKQVLQPAVLAVNEVVANVEKMLRRLIGEDVDLQVELAPGAGNVRVDPAQLELVLMNLVVNARDAMPRGGTLRIATGRAEVGPQQPPAGGPPAGPYVALAVADTGCGMDAAIAARAFEPFFTTKAPGKGTGLGLATVYGVVTQSGGQVQLESEVGEGTTVTILLPRVADDVPAVHARREAAPSGGSETILVVEDEESIRRVAERVLGRAGYRVLTAASADEALERWASAPSPVQLLLTDLVLPGMDGAQLAARLVARQPGLRVLYMSGYAGKSSLAPGCEVPWTCFLQKPFAARDLVARVRAALDRADPG